MQKSINKRPRPRWKPRFHDLIEAFESMSKENLVLVIVGSNYIEDEYVKKIHSLSSEKVIFLGTKVGNDLKALYDNAALLVNPSSMEGFCLVIAEGLSAKTPILASDIPPHREFELNESCYFPPSVSVAVFLTVIIVENGSLSW